MAQKKARSSLRKLRTLRAGSLMLLGLMVVFQYQNCAPTSHASSLASGSPVSIIDKNDTQGLDVSFAQKSVTIQSSTESVNLDGICSSKQDGSIFQWQLKNSEGGILDSGMVTCQSGAFKVEVNPTQALDCDQTYQISAQLGLGQAGQVILTRKCEATETTAVTTEQRSLASDSIQTALLKSSQPNANLETGCVTEKREGDGSGCSIACYTSEGVETQHQLLPASVCGF